MSVSYRLIRPRELHSHQIEAWRRIQLGSPAFQSPYFCPEFSLLVDSVRDDVRVVIIEHADEIVGFFPHQRSAFFGIGRPVGGPLSDYHGVIAEEGADWELEPLMRAARLNVWDFDHLVGDTRSFGKYVTGSDISPQIDLRNGYPEYVKDLRPSGLRYIKNAERLARKLTREVGEISFSLHEGDEAVLAQLICWKSEQYHRSKIPDVFGVPWTVDLLRKVMATQTPGFAGVCSVLRVDGQAVAAHMGMRSRRVLHYWFPAYHLGFSNWSPGIILLLRMTQAIDGKEINIIDFGKGGSQYKRLLMNSEVVLQEGAVELSSLVKDARKAYRAVDKFTVKEGIPRAVRSPLRVPLRAINRIERSHIFK